MDSSYAVRGHLDKRSIERSVWKISFKMADGSWFRRVTSGNPERFPDENVNVTKSRRSPEIGERGLVPIGWLTMTLLPYMAVASKDNFCDLREVFFRMCNITATSATGR